MLGADDEIRRRAGGGWAGLAQSRFRRRAEDSWKRNAFQVADRVAKLAANVGAQVIVVSGEVHVVHHLRARLAGRVTAPVRHVPGSRAAERPPAAQREALRSVLREVAADQTQQLLDLVHRHDDGEAAVQGRHDTVAALAAGRVDILLVDPTLATDPVRFGADATALVDSPDPAHSYGWPSDVAPLAHAAVRSALLAGARVRVLPPGRSDGPREGIGALCRYRVS